MKRMLHSKNNPIETNVVITMYVLQVFKLARMCWFEIQIMAIWAFIISL